MVTGTIAMADYWNADTGTLNDWYVEICTTEEALGVNDNDEIEDFVVYPNPSNGMVNVSLISDDNVNISLYDVRGRRVYTELFDNNSVTFTKELNFSAIASGIYMLNVESGAKRTTKKLVIQ